MTSYTRNYNLCSETKIYYYFSIWRIPKTRQNNKNKANNKESQAKAQETRREQLQYEICSKERTHSSSECHHMWLTKDSADPPTMALYHRHTGKTRERPKQLINTNILFCRMTSGKQSTANNLNAHESGAGGAVSAQWNNHTVYRSVDMCAPSTSAFTAGCQFLVKEGHKYMCWDVFQMLYVFLIKIG